VFDDIKITSYYGVCICTSGEKVRISDEEERVQSVSYSHIKIIIGVVYIMSLSLTPIEETVKQGLRLIV